MSDYGRGNARRWIANIGDTQRRGRSEFRSITSKKPATQLPAAGATAPRRSVSAVRLRFWEKPLEQASRDLRVVFIGRRSGGTASPSRY